MIREEGPTWHEKKSGTPTMGGLLFIIAMLVASVVSGAMAGLLSGIRDSSLHLGPIWVTGHVG